MKRNENGVVVPSDESPLPWKPWPCFTPIGLVDANGRWTEKISWETIQFQAHAANYHERFADIVRRLVTWADESGKPGTPMTVNLFTLCEDAASLWKEYREEPK